MIRCEMVHLIEVLQADAVFLGDGVHRLTIAHIMQPVFVILGRLLLLLLQPDNFSFLKLIALIAFVILGQFFITDTHLLCKRLERITTTGYQIVVLVEALNDVKRFTSNGVILRVLNHELVIALGIVILIEFV